MTAAESSEERTFDRRAIPQGAVESRWTAPGGQSIRRIDWLLPRGACRGSLLFMPGRGDAYEKYLETLNYWNSRGWRVTASDWRGQAGSGRLGKDAVTGHIDDFATWVSDLAALWQQWRLTTPGPHVLIGHSMGGHLVLRALAEHRVNPDAAVLVAPMVDFIRHGVPAVLMHNAAKVMAAIGDAQRPAWKWGEKPGVFPVDRINLLTNDTERYADEVWWRDYRPEIAMGPGSWGWAAAAYASTRLLARRGMLEQVKCPALLLSVDNDRLVSSAAIERAALRIPRGELVRFGSEARHELLREGDPVRDRALAAIDDFLGRMAPVRD
ncbi:MAG: alpha/beta hydrolase [Novosphingobium sp.]